MQEIKYIRVFQGAAGTMLSNERGGGSLMAFDISFSPSQLLKDAVIGRWLRGPMKPDPKPFKVL